MEKNYDAVTLILRRPRVATFADIIKAAATFIKTIFKETREIVRIRIRGGSKNLLS